MNDDTDIIDGSRATIDGRFLSRRRVETDAGRVTRLLVTNRDSEADTPTAVLAGPDHHGELYGLRAGSRYVCSNLEWCVPPTHLDRVDDHYGQPIDCPDCGGDLRARGTYDDLPDALREAAASLDLDGPFAVVTAATTVRTATGGVDDWRPQDGDGPWTGASHGTEAFACLDCGRRVDPNELLADRDTQVHEYDLSEDEFCASPGVSFDAPVQRMATGSAAPAAETVGLTTGGANDASNFRENVHSGYTPQPDALAVEGLFGDYHFPTDGVHGGATDTLFAPTYATGVGDHPLTGERERYLAVGLDSTLSVADFERPRLDLVVVLDVSGSMGSAFDRYYYDEHGRRRERDDHDATTKLDAAKESLCALTEQLRPDDRFGVVLFDHRAHVAKPLRDVASTDMDAIRAHVREVRTGGSTDMAAGFDAARTLFVDAGSTDAEDAADTRADSERRVVFMTDAMPNTGVTRGTDLVERFAAAADDGVHTTFVGMGLDANADLVGDLSAVRGANHFFVNSAAEFERRVGREFDYAVTPLVYDLSLDVVADGYEIAGVYGSPNADAATGEVMYTATLFPSPKRDGETRGGVVLVELDRTAPDGDAVDDATLALDASWTERDGTAGTARVTVDFPDPDAAPYYDHDGVRKAVALTRYARVLRTWARTVREGPDDDSAGDPDDVPGGVDDWRPPDVPPRERGEHERGSVPLRVPEAFVPDLVDLQAYLAAEREALDDETLAQELDVLDALLDAADADPGAVE